MKCITLFLSLLVTTFPCLANQGIPDSSSVFTDSKTLFLRKGLPSDSLPAELKEKTISCSYAELDLSLIKKTVTFIVSTDDTGIKSFWLLFPDNETEKLIQLHPSGNSRAFTVLRTDFDCSNREIDLAIFYDNKEQLRCNISYKTNSRDDFIFYLSPSIEEVNIIEENNEDRYSTNSFIGHSKHFTTYTAQFNFSVGLDFCFLKTHVLEVRPGVAAYQNPFSGLELGVYYNTLWTPEFFSFIGIAAHIGFEGAHGTANYINYSGAYMYTAGAGFGLTESLAITASVAKIDSDNIQYVYDYGTYVRSSWQWLFKLGIRYNY